MTLTNIYIHNKPVCNIPRVQFNTLNPGDRYQHTEDGPVSRVYFKGEKWITINRADDWLVRHNKDSEIWNKMVIKFPRPAASV
jgi:hypothetical protein